MLSCWSPAETTAPLVAQSGDNQSDTRAIGISQNIILKIGCTHMIQVHVHVHVQSSIRRNTGDVHVHDMYMEIHVHSTLAKKVHRGKKEGNRNPDTIQDTRTKYTCTYKITLRCPALRAGTCTCVHIQQNTPPFVHLDTSDSPQLSDFLPELSACGHKR